MTNMYDIINKLNSLTSTKVEDTTVAKTPVYESVEPRGSISEAVKTLESKFKQFKESNSKPDYIDLDKDGNKKEPMKKAAKDAKKVKEGYDLPGYGDEATWGGRSYDGDPVEAYFGYNSEEVDVEVNAPYDLNYLDHGVVHIGESMSVTVYVDCNGDEFTIKEISYGNEDDEKIDLEKAGQQWVNGVHDSIIDQLEKEPPEPDYDLDESSEKSINFSADDLNRLNRINDLDELKQEAFKLISNPTRSRMKPEKVAWFKHHLEGMTKHSAIIKMMYDLLLSGEGHSVIGDRYSTKPNTYRSKFGEEVELDEAKVEMNFTADDLNRLSKITDLNQLKSAAFELISKPSQRPMKPEKIEWFKHHLEGMTRHSAIIKMMYDLLLSGEGLSVIGSKGTMNSNSYRSKFGEDVAEGTIWDDDYDEETAEEDSQDEGFFVAIQNADGSGFVGAVVKEGGKWVERKVSGTPPHNWGGTYMSYLKPNEVMQWIKQDYRRSEVFGPFETEDEAMEYAEGDLHEANLDPSGLIAAASMVRDFIVTAEVDGKTKKFRIRGMSGPNAAKERFLRHYSMANVVDVKPVPEDEINESIKIGSKVKIHAPGKDYHDQVGHVGEIRHGAYKGAPKTYTVDYGNRKSVQLDKKNVKLHKEEANLEEGRRGTFRAGSKSYFKAGQSAIKNIQRAEKERKEKEQQEKEQDSKLDELSTKKYKDVAKRAEFSKNRASDDYANAELYDKDNEMSDADRRYRKHKKAEQFAKSKVGIAETSLTEKSKSKAQQRFFGMVHAAQKGEKPASKEVSKVAKSMGKRDVTDFAKTKHKGLPNHVTESRVMEAHSTFEHILQRYPAEVKQFERTQQLDNDLYDALYDYYRNAGEMPYGVAKARSGDPMEWIADKFAKDIGIGVQDELPFNNELDEIAQLAGLSMDKQPVVDENSGPLGSPEEEPVMDEGNEFSQALAAARASGQKEFEVGGKRYLVKEDVNLSITANGEDDALNLIRKLSGMPSAPVANEPECSCQQHADQDLITGGSDGVEVIELPVEEERDIEYVNTPREKTAPLSAAYPSGSDMHRAKKSYSDKPYRGDNPMAERKVEESLWKKYSDMLKGLTK